MERRLAAILAADVVGFSRLMGDDEAGTLGRLKSLHKELVRPRIRERKGRIVKLMGDGLLAEFASVVEAVQCAVDIQRSMTGREADLSDARRLRLRIGVNLGDIIVEGADIYGDGVNVAARLEGLAEPGSICISGTVFEHVEGKVDLRFADLGAQRVKNIAQPVRVYRIALEDPLPGDGKDGPAVVTEHDRKFAIAVLPFTNMSGDPDQEYFSDGLSEDIITELGRFRELVVIARNSSFSYKGRTVKVQEIGRDLGVDYVVEGSVRKVGDRVRITAQLIETANGNHVWAERFDRTIEDIFDLQDEITQVIVTRLPGQLQGALLQRARRKPSDNLTAYDLFLQGRWLMDKAFYQSSEALELFSKAVELDPHCAHAYAYTAIAYAYSVFTFSPLGPDPIATARANIDRALAEGEGDHFIHAIAGEVFLICGEHERAATHAKKADHLNPNDVFTMQVRGDIAAYSGDPKTAISIFLKLKTLDPLAPEVDFEILAESYYMLRDYEKALEVYQSWHDPPVHTLTHMAACYAQLGKIDAAQAVVGDFRARCPDADVDTYLAAHARLCKLPEDADHWFDGYRKAGLMP